MKLLFVNYEYPPLGGGGGVAHRDIAEALAKRHEVHVLTTHFPGLAREAVENGVHLHRTPVWGRTELPTATVRSMVTFAPAAFFAGRRLIKKIQPALMHVFFAVPSGVPAVFLARHARLPLVLTVVGADIFDPTPTAGIATHTNPLVRRTVRWVIRSADAVTAISSDTRDKAIQYHDAPARTTVIPLGLVSPSVLPPIVPAKNGELRLVTVGRLIPRKGLDDLLHALALLADMPLSLTIIGGGPLRGALEEQAQRLGIASRVHFAGPLSEARKWELLRSSDVFVSPSLHEGFGMVFLEAMHAGLPIIATDRGGQRDFLTHEHNALLVPPEQPRALADAIRRLMQDSTLRTQIATACSATVDGLRIDRTASAYEQLFEEVLRTKK